MSGDNWKTLRVPPEAYDEAKAQKEANDRTWGEQLVCSNDSTTESGPTPDVVVESVEVNTERSGVDATDVERIVENWVENNYEDLRRVNL